MNKAELLNNVFFENAKGDLPIIYITSDDDVVKVGGIINAPMLEEFILVRLRKPLRRMNCLPTKSSFVQAKILRYLLISVATDARHLIAMSQLMIVALISLSYEKESS